MIPSLVDDDSSPVVASRRRGGGGGSRRERDDTSNRSHDLAGVQQSLRIESLLDRAHDGHGLPAVHVAAVPPFEPEITPDMRAGLEPDHRPALLGITERQMQDPGRPPRRERVYQ